MNNLKVIYNEVEQLKDFDSYTPYQQRCNKLLHMIEDFQDHTTIVDNQLLQKFWNAFYKEEDEWEKLFVGTSNHEKWFTSYRPWLQAGFEIAIKVLSQEIEKQNGTN